MNSALTATVALAGLFFSLSLALLLEELLFGVVFRLMQCSRRIAAGMKAKAAVKGSFDAITTPPDGKGFVI
jgi:hypothetical protein